MSILIAKADGTLEPFDERKLVSSLSHAGADRTVAGLIAGDVQKSLRQGMTTGEIYRMAFARLREHKRGVAARYSLKRAVLDFGPTGFPFEVYLARLFAAEGWDTKVDQIIKGKCVEHEVDVVMSKKGSPEIVFVEAKFHNTAGFKTDLKTVLYVQARQEDIGRGRGMVVTNTKFTPPAEAYASCQGLELLGWEYPQGKTLHDRIDASRVYPVTALTTLNKREKAALLGQKVVLCQTLSSDTRALATAGVTGRRADQVLEEAGALCIPGGDV